MGQIGNRCRYFLGIAGIDNFDGRCFWNVKLNGLQVSIFLNEGMHFHRIVGQEAYAHPEVVSGVNDLDLVFGGRVQAGIAHAERGVIP